jgi:hypothetical protein
VINEEVLHRVRKERSFLRTIKPRKANWISRTLHRQCLLNHLIEGQFKGREEGKDVSSYRMALRKRENTGI